ncbi:MAG: redox-regulated ATPase YchF [Desulfobia sp.]
MGFRCGIAGLPNVGKSTIFNALTAAGIESANYPFCTINPNVGMVQVPDPRLDRLAELVNTRRKVPARMEFVDIAGLVAGASQGEGLGNQFLGHIRQVDAIAHVVRCFEDPNISHIDKNIEPLRDRDIVNTEFMLADLETVEKRLDKTGRQAKSGDRTSRKELAILEQLRALLNEGKPARHLDYGEDGRALLKELCLLTSKPVLYIANVREEDIAGGNQWVQDLQQAASEEEAGVITISGPIEAELSGLEPEEQKEFLANLGMEQPGLNRLIRAGYSLLGLINFFTVDEKETRAWTVPKDCKAHQAAGIIHSDFERGFIRAEVIRYEDYIACGSEAKVKEKGLMHLEGKDYIVQDGDCINFRFNV